MRFPSNVKSSREGFSIEHEKGEEDDLREFKMMI